MNCRGAPQANHAPETITPGQWPLRSSLQLGALPTATPCARMHARRVLHEWGNKGIADTAELLVSELVTNGVKAVQLLEQRPPIWLRMSTDGVRLLIEVWDGNMQLPRPSQPGNKAPSPTDEGGRGLFLVEMLSRQWSWHPTAEPRGKVVWCELDTSEAPDQEASDATSRDPLPRRVYRARQARPVKAMDDLYTLWRVRNGLRRIDQALVHDQRTAVCYELILKSHAYLAPSQESCSQCLTPTGSC
jgi:anti-sigma regulatory factor (Ser/Thr protein kinase)